jgi:hypothetical protein
MEKSKIDQVSGQVFRQFPEVRGCSPKIKNQSVGQYLFIYEGNGTTADGKTIRHIVRVVVREDGSISKITSSR